MSLVDVERLREIAEVEFADIVADASIPGINEPLPRHFHDGTESNVSESHISAIPEEALREFLKLVRDRMGTLAGRK